MGMMQRIEQRLERMVDGGFARVFKADVEPVELAAALRRECDTLASAGHRGRTVTPNDFVVELSVPDYDRLAPNIAQLIVQLADAVGRYANDQRYLLIGPPEVRLVRAADLAVGVYRITGRLVREPEAPRPQPWLEINGARFPFTGPAVVLGRGDRVDIRIDDAGVSSRHAVVELGPPATITDLGSTNGTTVDGRPAGRGALRDGSRIVIGATSVVFRAPGS